jgi:RNA polymerase sigma factor (sigma-70 family)
MKEPAEGAHSDADRIEESLVEPGAFSYLFGRHAGSVHRYLSKRVGQATAEDLVGETFAVAFRSRASYDLAYPDARPWLFGIATNLTRHHWRAEGRRLAREANHAPPVVIEPDTSEAVAERLFLEAQGTPIVEALAKLVPAQRDIVLLMAGPGLSYEEISVALRIPVGTVRSRLARARLRLRELLGNAGQYLDVGHPGPSHSILNRESS